jgi:hypothetical protein
MAPQQKHKDEIMASTSATDLDEQENMAKRFENQTCCCYYQKRKHKYICEKCGKVYDSYRPVYMLECLQIESDGGRACCNHRWVSESVALSNN